MLITGRKRPYVKVVAALSCWLNSSLDLCQKDWLLASSDASIELGGWTEARNDGRGKLTSTKAFASILGALKRHVPNPFK